MESGLAVLRGMPRLCARCARLAGAAIAFALLAAPACGGNTTAGGSGGTSSGGASGVCSDPMICCTFACDYGACPETDAAPLTNTCFCDFDYQSRGKDCLARAGDLYKCMYAHKAGYVCTSPGNSAFRCNAFCPKQAAAEDAACKPGVVQCAP